MSIRALAVLRRPFEAFRARTGLHPALPFLIAGCFLALLFKLDPFGLEAASAARSEQATLRITAPLYHSSGLVTAVVIDDDYIKSHDAGWPLPYAEQGGLMRAILGAKPAVLLIDLVYPHRHRAPAALPKPASAAPGAPPAESGDIASKLLRPLMTSAGTSIVFTVMAKTGFYDFCSERLEPRDERLLFDQQSMQEELRTQLEAYKPNQPGSQVRRAYIRWSGCGDRYPLLLGGNPNTVTPAFAAYTEYCRHDPSRPQCAASPPDTHPQDYLQPMIVRSGAFPPQYQSFAYGRRTCQKPGHGPTGAVSHWRRFWAMVDQLALGVFFKDVRADPNNELSLPCPAVTVVPMSVLETATVEERHQLLAGKAVLIGATLSGSPDIVTTAVHGQVPGVIWHAMALDNLLSLGPGYLAERHEMLQHSLYVVLVLAFAYSFPFIVWLIDHRLASLFLASLSLAVWCGLVALNIWFGHPRIAAFALAIALILDLTKPRTSAGYFLAAGIAAGASVFALDRGVPAGNWFGLVLVVIAFTHTIKPYYSGEERKHFPHTSSLLGKLYQLTFKKEPAHE